jgi:hypothetical protein
VCTISRSTVPRSADHLNYHGKSAPSHP